MDIFAAAKTGDVGKMLQFLNSDNKDAKDGRGRSAISWASGLGHFELVELLLSSGADSATKDSIEATPLSWAARNGHDSVVSLLLGQGVDRDCKDEGGRTPLSWAAGNGHHMVVKQLLTGNRVERNPQDKYGWTPLWWAIAKRHTEVVKQLLAESEVDPNSLEKTRLPPFQPWELTYSDTRGAYFVDPTGMEIARRFDPRDGQPNGKLTPLLWAAAMGYVVEVKQLLAHSRVDQKCQDDTGQTALIWAARNGHTEVVKQLLTESKVDQTAKDNNGQTALIWAANNKYPDVIKQLLADEDGQASLLWAAKNGHIGVVKKLLAESQVGPDPKDEYGRTPLSWAAEKGDAKVVAHLLYCQANPDSKDKDNRTPLSWAATQYCQHEENMMGRVWVATERPEENKCIRVMDLLLKKDVDPNPRDYEGQTPLVWALRTGYKKVVELLLTQRRINLNSKDKNDQTPLIWAIRSGHTDVAVRLLTNSWVDDVNSKDTDGRTPLSWAAEKGDAKVVAHILHSQINPDSKDKNGRTPLSWASGKGHYEVVKQFTDSRATLDSSDNDGCTPLSWAAKEGHGRVVNLLLSQRPLVNPASQDIDDWTPLSRAIENGHCGVVNSLIPNDDITLHVLVKKGKQTLVESLLYAGYNVNTQDNDGKTPLQRALQTKNRGIIEVLLKYRAETKYITAREWRDGFEKKDVDILRISKGSNGLERVEFPTPGELLPMSTQPDSKTRLFVFVDRSLWSKMPINNSKEQPKYRPLEISFPREKNGHPIDVSVSFRYPIDQRASQNHLGIHNSECKIAWKLIRSTNPGKPSWRPIAYFSMLPHGWIPRDEFDFLGQFIIYLKENWLKMCQQLEELLTTRRLDQLRLEGKNPDFMHRLAQDAERLAGLRAQMQRQVGAAEKFITDYSQYYHANESPTDLQKLLTSEFELGINNRFGQLDQTVRDLLQIEFSWASVTEARISTRLAQNVMLLTYVSIFYLPLAFCAALWAIPGITDSSIRNPFIITSIVVGLVTLFVAFNLENMAALIGGVYRHWREKVVEYMRNDDH